MPRIEGVPLANPRIFRVLLHFASQFLHRSETSYRRSGLHDTKFPFPTRPGPSGLWSRWSEYQFTGRDKHWKNSRSVGRTPDPVKFSMADSPRQNPPRTAWTTPSTTRLFRIGCPDRDPDRVGRKDGGSPFRLRGNQTLRPSRTENKPGGRSTQPVPRYCYPAASGSAFGCRNRCTAA